MQSPTYSYIRPMFNTNRDINIARMVWVMVVVVFVIDLLAPTHYDVVYAYLLAHFLSASFREKSDVILLAVVTSVLTILAIVFKSGDAFFAQIFLDRAPAIISFWAAAFFVIRFINLRDEEERQEGRFKALFLYSNQGIILSNNQGMILMANPALEKLFGYEPDELLGKTIESLIPARMAQRHVEHRHSYQQNPHARAMGTGLSLFGMRKDGSEFPVEVSLSPFKNQEGAFVIAFVIDNTLRKNHEFSIMKQKQELSRLSDALWELNQGLEQKVAERTRELEQAQLELQSSLEKERELGELKSRFVSMASHEFRTPLTSVLSSAGLIQQYVQRQDMANILKHSDRIKNSVNGLNSILTEFLSLGRLEEGRVMLKKETADITECVADVQEGLKSLFKPGQTFEHRHTGETAIHTDCNLLKNILINLISNAIKYSPENKLISVESKLDTGRLRVSVHDQGMGIPEADQKHLFERFFRASNSANTTQGTGLGLYIVQRYVEMLGGTLGFQSDVDSGSTFWIKIDA